MNLQQTISAIANAIDRMEGPGAPRNNPGNLRSWGSNPVQGGFAVFPTLEAGRAALERQIELNINRGLTLEEFFAGKPGVYAGYAPSADRNNPELYARNVSQWTGIPLGVPLPQVVGRVWDDPMVTAAPVQPPVGLTPPPVTYDTDTVFEVTATGQAFGDLGYTVPVIILCAAVLLLAASMD